MGEWAGDRHGVRTVGREPGQNRGVPRRPASPNRGRGGDTPAAPRRTRAAAQPESTPARLVRLLSVRALVLGVVVLAAFALLFPTVRAYLSQRAELDALRAQVAEAEEEERTLQHELDRWQDPAYVAAQARERLGYVLPGETAFRVIDPEVVVEESLEEDGGAPTTGPTVPLDGAVNPWYATVWDSVLAAGEAEVPTDPAAPGTTSEVPDAGTTAPGDGQG